MARDGKRGRNAYELLKWYPHPIKNRGCSDDSKHYVFPINMKGSLVRRQYCTYYPCTHLFSIDIQQKYIEEPDIKATRKIWAKDLKMMLGHKSGYIFVVEPINIHKGIYGLHIEYYCYLDEKPSDELMNDILDLFRKPLSKKETECFKPEFFDALESDFFDEIKPIEIS